MRGARPACVVIIAASLAAPLGSISPAAEAGASPSPLGGDPLAALLPTLFPTLAPAPSADPMLVEQAAPGEEEVQPQARQAAVPSGGAAVEAAPAAAASPAAAPKRQGGLRSRASALLAQGFFWPTRGAVTSMFGWRDSRRHNGIDIAANYGTRIYAAQAGRVSYAGWYGGYGRTVILDHGSGTTTLYGHASRLLVSAGQEVEAGQEIARVGSSGFSQGPHLHFEIRRWGRPVDPLIRAELPRPASRPAPGGTHYVQVGAYRVAGNAEARVEEMREIGFAAEIKRVNELYLVRVGGYPDRGSSDRAVADLRALGIDAFVTR